MNWSQEDLDAFIKVIDPADEKTGGGTASAVAGAMAAGLSGMVARLSVGREGPETDEYYREIDAEAQVLTAALMRGGREDSDAFGAVMNAFTLPKSTEEEKAARSRAIQDAMIGAARVPLANAERCLEVLGLVTRLEGRSNTNAASDLEVGRALAATGLEGCLANVEINVGSIKDDDAAAALSARVSELRDATSGGGSDHG
jgi:formiminotetrahydrofolate cyclodeaminase